MIKHYPFYEALAVAANGVVFVTSRMAESFLSRLRDGTKDSVLGRSRPRALSKDNAIHRTVRGLLIWLLRDCPMNGGINTTGINNF